MTNEEVRSHNAKIVDAIKADVARVHRGRKLMFETLKAMAIAVDEQPIGVWKFAINAAIRAAE